MKNSKNHLLLLETVLNILIFALCAGVCLSLLFCARTAMDESRRLTEAVELAQSLAETWSGQSESNYGGYTAKCRLSGDTLTIQIFSRSGEHLYTLVSHGEAGA